MNEREQKFCACVVHVAEKQPGACNFEKAWFEERDEKVCYNPFAVCAKTTKTSTRKCREEYNYDEMTDSELKSIANLHGIDTTDFKRKRIISEMISK